MSQRRMFSQDITNSDAFLDMPVSSQVLYFHLAMRADDDGFVTPRMVMRLIGSTEDDLKVLKAKRFVLAFESGVIIIKHWLIHNLIRADLYKETLYKKEKATLGLNENGAYTELRSGVSEIKQIESPEWLKRRRGELRTANVPQTAPRLGKDRLGKDRLGKDRLGKVNTTTPTAVGVTKSDKRNPEVQAVIDTLNECLEGVPMDGTNKDNRFYARLLVQKLKKACKAQGYEEEKALGLAQNVIRSAFQGWHRKNATNVQYIYYNMAKIIQESKSKKLTLISI